MDFSNFEEKDFTDKDKYNYMKYFVVPEGLRQLSDRLSVTSNQTIPAFDGNKNYCDDEGKIKINH